MVINFFGLKINMMMHLQVMQVPMLVVDLIIATCFTAGFISYYSRLSRLAFHDDERNVPQSWRVVARWALPVMSIGTGTILHFMGYLTHKDAMMFHNIGLFMLVFTLLDEHINIVEYAARVLGAVWVWQMHHNMHYDRPQFWLSLALLFVAVVLMRKYHEQIRYNIWLNIATFTYIAIIFWTLIPPFADSAHEIHVITLEAIIMFIAMASVTALFWIGQHRAEEHNDEMAKLANFDQLTNARTYALYRQDITKMFDAARSNNQPLTMAAIDVDHFKQINDHYGHLAGNAILVGVATTLETVLRQHQAGLQVYRTGGEEFNILFPNMTSSAVLPIMKDAWHQVQKSHFTYEEYDVQVTMSCGITALKPTDAKVDDLYKRADDNLYQSKRNGRDTITIEGETQSKGGGKRMLATYTFFTQSMVDTDAQTDQPVGNELLLRVYDYDHEKWIVPPTFNVTVDTQIALMDAALKNSASKQVALNLTHHQFTSMHVADKLVEYKENTPELTGLIIELTQVPSVETMQKMAPIYHHAGIRIAIDDVGSDNHFEALKSLLPYIDGVKFAMQNLRSAHDTANLEERMSFWSKLASKYEIDFIIEGIENEQDAEYAKTKLHARYLQGFYYDRPELPRLD
ncbi:Signal transduction diguanylate cyclase [Lacticaseibacillus sharpeae JCM 1186 = DSM 20505]|uniref:Signal transduction diguanylate cyclase n=3 Tax=Lacticaseibacillus sharpeae TaxID=1626 RepID=A0A0R1ZU37_9LACO|nr:Signal transduction diguanylate cyclase [Lacticaseibacillus sharpeae JCM 1186 = DSM 20505]